MTIEQDFLPFANGGGANVLTQSAYAALTSILANGFSAGTAQSAQLNKVWRQSSIMAAVVAQFIVNQTGQPAIDDGTTATLLSNLATAVAVSARQNPVLTDTGAANAYAVANLAAFTAYPTASGLVIDVSIANANTGASTLNVDGLGIKPIVGLGLQPLQGGELVVKGVACLMYVVASTVNSGNGAWVLMECGGGAQQIAPATQSGHALQLGQATGRLLRTTVYAIVGGTQQVSVNGGAFTSTGATTFSTQSLTALTKVRIIGGGGGGGGAAATGASQSSCGGGGGAGGYAETIISGALSSVAVTVGSAGAGGAAGLSNGTNGGTSSFGALVSATGGGGGLAGATASSWPVLAGVGAGGNGVGGSNFNSKGSSGGIGLNLSSASFATGAGANSVIGGGAPSVGTTSAGANAASPGAGGSGGGCLASVGAGSAGGNAAAGYIEIQEYC